ncbi:hypothetical protein AB0F91_28470 [Amycolatopsis sp. NPDC023774]|uniref:hypothetical protein n=1 Tax=Amycolatopsis sp. NPDC023774 TaxID=3155015 RepID=UPI0033D25003
MCLREQRVHLNNASTRSRAASTRARTLEPAPGAQPGWRLDALRGRCHHHARHQAGPKGLLGSQGEKSLTTPPEFPPNVADDTTPVEFSLAFDTTGEYVVRVLGETVGSRSPREFLDQVAGEYGLVTDRLDAVADLFRVRIAPSDVAARYTSV